MTDETSNSEPPGSGMSSRQPLAANLRFSRFPRDNDLLFVSLFWPAVYAD
jgi:hypothetical protein